MSTPRYGHAPIAMARKDSIDDFTRAGHFCWRFDTQGRRSLWVAIPRREFPERGRVWSEHQKWVLSEWTIDHKNHCDAQWSWDGNEKRPTLKPSLHAVGTWHGYVRGGMLVEA